MQKLHEVAAPEQVDSLALFHPAVQSWFRASFPAPTKAQKLGWPPIARGESTLILAPTGSGKTLAAFMWCIERLMFAPPPPKDRRCRILYVSPLKALAVDVERNLRAPIAGIACEAEIQGAAYVLPSIGIRTGDTPAADRARFARQPSDILITTPESLYLLLTSNTREALRSIDTVIIDEIHSLVPNKRGAHLALSLERLGALRDRGSQNRSLQRIGLSATQRPLDEVARYLGGAHCNLKSEIGDSRVEQAAPEPPSGAETINYRAVKVVDAGEKKRFDLRVEVPIEDMARLGEMEDTASGSAAQERRSIWTAIHPKLLDLIRQHRSTLIFVNGRRLAERIAAALNELAGETLVRAHHGSLARLQRLEVEDQLKSGTLRGLVATSSLELGIDMGAIDLVVQIEAPPSVATGIQRIGRGGHQAGATSLGTIFPKFRGDLVACAAATRAMSEGHVEAIHYPRNPLDVLAQQIVAMAALDQWQVEELFSVVRRAAPFASLSRNMFESVLDMLAGRYPSDDFAELRPRITWDRVTNTIVAREGARRIAVMNGGTISDRGLYGVFLTGAEKGSARVGELDEEMVFESHLGETFLLGASTWRIEEITHDRVLVSPAPGEPGKMPFWHGDRPGRPLEFGRVIGELVRALRGMPQPTAVTELIREHGLDQNAAENLVRYLADQAAAAGAIPDDQTVVIERYRDDLGDCIYDGDAPLAERRAQALTVDPAQLRELLGEVDFRELLDRQALEEIEQGVSALDERHHVKTADGLHDLLLRLGDLSEDEMARRCSASQSTELVSALLRARRAVPITISDETRYIAVEDAARYRDALGASLPAGIPAAFLEPVRDPAGDLLRRYARTHGPFTLEDVVARFGISSHAAESELKRLAAAGKLLTGEFRPGGFRREWCDAEILRRARQFSLAKLRREVEPVQARAFARLVTRWQGVVKPRRGLDALLDAVGSLQGAAISASILETEVLPARVENYAPSDLDTLMAAGEVVWCGVEPLGERDGRVELFLADQLPRLWEPRRFPEGNEGSERAIRAFDLLRARGASFFAQIHQATGGGYPGETTEALWYLVWRGLVTNDTFAAVRARVQKASRRERRAGSDGRVFHSRRLTSPSTQGRWSLVESRLTASISPTERGKAMAEQMLSRYGVLTREAVAAEGLPGGFSAVYPILKALEESGQIRRGMFVAGLGATQFALPAALELLRSLRDEPETAEVLQLAAADPANPYGAVLGWPPLVVDDQHTLARSVGATVILVDGALAAYFRRGNPEIQVFLPEAEPVRSRVARSLAKALGDFAMQEHQVRHGRGLLVSLVNGLTAASHPMAWFLEEAGFTLGGMGYHLRRRML